MAENTKITSEEVKEEKVETAKNFQYYKEKGNKSTKKRKKWELISRDRIDQVTCLWHLGF